MSHSLSHAVQYGKASRRRLLQKFVSVVCCTSMLCTLLPLSAAAADTVCGLEAHTHSKACYTQVTTRQVTKLACTATVDADMLVHTHDPSCSDAEGNLLCTLTERQAHAHGADCFQAGHTHTAECYDQEQAVICGQEATPNGEPVQTCTKEVVELHTHSAECRNESGKLQCGKLQVVEHVHTDACFTVENVPVDTKALTCQLPEAHAHVETCRDESGALTCKLLEAHTHGEACYGKNDVLTCEQDEIAAHSHGDLCHGTWKLTCEKEEHTHTEECQTPAALTAEEQAQVEAVIARIDALESADQVEETLEAYEEAEQYEAYAAYREEAAQKTQAVRDSYNALSDAQKQSVTNAEKLAELEWLVPTSMLPVSPEDSNQGQILPSLDGDWAYISDFKVTKTLTGTSPWDANDNAGNDSSAANEILRTFDIASYEMQFSTALRASKAQGVYGGIKQGRLFFEFVLPVSAEKAQFEIGEMGWLQTREAEYEVVTDQVNGIESQVLRGSYLMTANDTTKAAIPGTNDLTVVVRALQMHNGDTLQPIFTLWLEHNLDYNHTYNNTQENEAGRVGAIAYDAANPHLPESIVTGNVTVCKQVDEYRSNTTDPDALMVTEEHAQTEEVKTIYGMGMKISSAPRFNIAITGIDTRNTMIGLFNFDATQNTSAINYGLGEVQGRLNGYGLRVELRGKTGQGMRGLEFPDETTPITFEIEMVNSFEPSNGTKQEVPEYLPLFWSGGGNSNNPAVLNEDQRSIPGSTVIMGIPCNKLNEGLERHARCYNGGTWKFEEIKGEDGKIEDGKLKVTISGFDFNTTHFPWSPLSGNEYDYRYYNPNTINNYWEIDWAIFSTGELWVLQPWQAVSGDDAGTYITDKYGPGQFFTKVHIGNLNMLTECNTPVTTETDPNDNDKEVGQLLGNPGSVNASVLYNEKETRVYNLPLTPGCYSTDRDWATAGSGVTLQTFFNHDGAEGIYTGVAYDMLLKFDDEFFKPDLQDCLSVGTIGGNQTLTTFWAALPDGGGWTDDEHMKSATEDDLVFYRSLADLYAAGKTPVGVLAEIRGVASTGQYHIHMFVDGTVKGEPGQVYMVTRNNYMWRKNDVADEALEYYNDTHETKYTSTAQLTDADYDAYAKNVFPSHKKDPNVKLFENGDKTEINGVYPTPFLRSDYYSNSGLAQARKASYDTGTYSPGWGALTYQDSCLVMPHRAYIEKSTAQTFMENGTAKFKTIYDVDYGQRTVTYTLSPRITRTLVDTDSTASKVNTIAYIEDILPVELSYIQGSSYYGGTYTQDPSYKEIGEHSGTPFRVVNGEEPTKEDPYLLEITPIDGRQTKLLWKIWVEADTNKAYSLDPIYFSCAIGEAVNVTDGQSISNTAKIWTTEDNKREFKSEFGNLDTFGILIERSNSVSLSNISDSLIFDWWEPFGFTMEVGNNGSNDIEDALIVNSLPYKGIFDSEFDGPMVVTDFSAELVGGNPESENNFRFYYTTDEAYAGKLSSQISEQLGGNLSDSNLKAQGWVPMPDDLSSANGQITSIIAVGTLPSDTTMKMHVSIKLPQGEQSDYLINYLSLDGLSSYARAQAVNRTLEGLTWYDADFDGIRDSSESLLSGIKVTLLQRNNAGKYEEYINPDTNQPVSIQTGQKISVRGENSAVTYEAGRYLFTDLPEGTFAVKFESGGDTPETGSIATYKATEVNKGNDDTLDSDGVATYSEDGAALLSTQITGITMPAATTLSYGSYASRNNDSGFYVQGYKLPNTGGMGTTVFYSIGGILVLAAIVLWDNKKRARTAV